MWIETILFSIQVFFAAVIFYLTIRMLVGRKPPLFTDKTFHISVVIPFRNEAKNLPALLESLAAQDYKGTYDVLLVNDQSSDNFTEVLKSLKNTFPGLDLHCLNSTYRENIKLTSKQQAIDYGIQHATGDWIALTDADMVLDANWLSTLTRATGKSFSITYGHTVTLNDTPSFFYTFQAFQLEFLFIAAYAFHCAGLKGSCMGNNMLVAKNTYTAVGGQAGIGYSIVEDVDLLNTVIKKGYAATASSPFTPTARTYPCKTVSHFFHQALRWIRGGARASSSLRSAMALYGLQNIIFLLSVCGLLPAPILWASIATVILLGIFVHIGTIKTGSQKSILFYPVFYLVSIFETLIMLFPALFISPVWKQRKL